MFGPGMQIVFRLPKERSGLSSKLRCHAMVFRWRIGMSDLPKGWNISHVTPQDQKRLLQAASQRNPAKATPFTRAGSDLTQHPHIVGLGSADDRSLGVLMKRFGGEAGINRAAMEWIGRVVQEGTCIRRVHPRKGPVLEFYDAGPTAISPQTNGVRFTERCEFLGFLGRPYDFAG